MRRRSNVRMDLATMPSLDYGHEAFADLNEVYLSLRGIQSAASDAYGTEQLTRSDVTNANLLDFHSWSGVGKLLFTATAPISRGQALSLTVDGEKFTARPTTGNAAFDSHVIGVSAGDYASGVIGSMVIAGSAVDGYAGLIPGYMHYSWIDGGFVTAIDALPSVPWTVAVFPVGIALNPTTLYIVAGFAGIE